MSIKKIMCCCGNGLGSSLLARINVQATVSELGHPEIEVVNSAISDASNDSADLFFVAKDLEASAARLENCVVLDNVMDKAAIKAAVEARL